MSANKDDHHSSLMLDESSIDKLWNTIEWRNIIKFRK